MTSLFDPNTYLNALKKGKSVLNQVRDYATKPETRTGALDKIKSQVSSYASNRVSETPSTKPKFDFGGLPAGTSVDRFGNPVGRYGGAFLDEDAILRSSTKKEEMQMTFNKIKESDSFQNAKVIPDMQEVASGGITKGIAGLGRMASESETPLRKQLSNFPVAGDIIRSLQHVGVLDTSDKMSNRERDIRESLTNYFDKVAKKSDKRSGEIIANTKYPKTTSIGASIYTSVAAMALSRLGVPILASFGGMTAGQQYQDASEADVSRNKKLLSSFLTGGIEGGIESVQGKHLIKGLRLDKLLSNKFWNKPGILKELGFQTAQEWIQSTGTKLTEGVIWKGIEGNTVKEKLQYLTDDYFDSFLTMLPLVLIPGAVSIKVQSDRQRKFEKVKEDMVTDIKNKFGVDDQKARYMQSKLEEEARSYINKAIGDEKLKYLKTPSDKQASMFGDELTPEPKKSKIEPSNTQPNEDRQKAIPIPLGNESTERGTVGEPRQSANEVGRDDEGSATPTGKRLYNSVNDQVRDIVKKPMSEITEDDKAILRKYEGAGGREKQGETGKGLLDEYYTPVPIVKEMWNLAKQYGFKEGGSVLEPSVGTGRFIEEGPKANYTGAEIDETSSKIAAVLTKDKGARIYNMPFEEMFVTREGDKKKNLPTYDLVIGNPPYGTHRGYYGAIDENKIQKYEDYFIKKGLDSLKFDGTLVMVVPSSFLKTGESKAKTRIMETGELVDAIRLPEKTFGTTSIGTDILVFKKNRNQSTGDRTNRITNDGWFKKHPEKIKGETKTRINRWNKEETYVAKKEETKTIKKSELGIPMVDMTKPVKTMPSTRDKLVEEGKAPEFGKQYRLTGKDSIMEGKNWKESKIEKEDNQQTKEKRTLSDFIDSIIDGIEGDTFTADRLNELKENLDSQSEDTLMANLSDIERTIEADNFTRENINSLSNLISEYKKGKEDANKSEVQYDILKEKRDVMSSRLKDYVSNVSLLKKLDPKTFNERALQAQEMEDEIARIDKILDAKKETKTGQKRDKGETKAKQKVLKKARSSVKTGDYYKSAVEYTPAQIKVWDSKRADTSIDTSQITDTSDLNTFKGKMYDNFDYQSGNIYEKLEQLKREDIDADQKAIQKAKLMEVLPAPQPIEKLDINPVGEFASTFIVGEDNRGKGISLKNEFADYLFGLPRDAFRPSSQNEVIGFLRGSSIQSGWSQNSSDEAKAKARKLGAAIKKRRKEVAEKYFRTFLDQLLPDVKNKIENKMNRLIYNSVRPDYKEVPLRITDFDETYGGKGLKMPDYKLDSIGYLSNSGSGINANGVGLGKTMMAIISTVQDMQRGWYKRPLFIVPNQIYQKWIDEIGDLFPNMKVIGLKNLGAESGIKTLKDVPLEDGAITIIKYEALTHIGFTDETFDRLTDELEDVFDDLSEDETKKTNRKREKEKAKREGIMGFARAKAKINIEDLGTDMLLIDEVHNFKNIFSSAKEARKEDGEVGGNKGRWGGLTGSKSKRGTKGWLMAQYVQELTGGRGIKLLSATPFSNNPLEYYNILSMVARQELKDMGIFGINTFMDTFIQSKNVYVVKANGKFVIDEVIEDWRNVKGLKELITRNIDFKDGADYGINRPNKVQKDHRMNPTELQLSLMKTAEAKLIETFEKIEQPDGSVIYQKNDAKVPGGILTFIGEAQKIALSPSLSVFYDGPELNSKEFVESSPKLMTMMSLIKANDKKTGQLIYYPKGVGSQKGERDSTIDIQNYLISELGYKPSQVGRITGKTKKTLIEVRDKFNSGEIKVLIGSDTIKEGIDLQENSTDLYITSYPWRPTDIIQVEGRIHRQGNKNPNVRINFLSVTDTIDPFMFQKLETKAKRLANASPIDQMMDTEEIDFEEAKGDLIKDPAKRLGIKKEMEKEGIDSELDASVAERAMKQNLVGQRQKLEDQLERTKRTLGYVTEGTERYKEIKKDVDKAKAKLARFIEKDINEDELKLEIAGMEEREILIKEKIKAIDVKYNKLEAEMKQAPAPKPEPNDYSKFEKEMRVENVEFMKKTPKEVLERELTEEPSLPMAEIEEAKKTMPTVEPKVEAKIDLTIEAKKYKSADEFVKSRGEVVYRGKASENKYATEFYFSKNKDYANKYGKAESFVVSPKNTYKADFEINHENVNRYLNSNKHLESSYDSISGIDAGTKENVIVMIGEKNFKTKAQLTDIWNKANKPKTMPTVKPKSFAQHKITGDITDIKSIQKDGFRQGMGINALPIYEGGEPTNVIDMKYGPKKGDIFILAPKDQVIIGGNGYKIKEGFKPTDDQIVKIEYDNQNVLEAPKFSAKKTMPTVEPKVEAKIDLTIEAKKFKSAEEFVINNDFIYQGGASGTKSRWWTTKIDGASGFASQKNIKNGEVRIAKWQDIPDEFKILDDELVEKIVEVNGKEFENLQGKILSLNEYKKWGGEIGLSRGMEIPIIGKIKPDPFSSNNELINIWNKANKPQTTLKDEVDKTKEFIKETDEKLGIEPKTMPSVEKKVKPSGEEMSVEDMLDDFDTDPEAYNEMLEDEFGIYGQEDIIDVKPITNKKDQFKDINDLIFRYEFEFDKVDETIDSLRGVEGSEETIVKLKKYKEEIINVREKELKEVEEEAENDSEFIIRANLEMNSKTPKEIAELFATMLRRNRFTFTGPGKTLEDWIEKNMEAQDMPTFIKNFTKLVREGMKKGKPWSTSPSVKAYMDALATGTLDGANMEDIIRELPYYLKKPLNAKRKQLQKTTKTGLPSVSGPKTDVTREKKAGDTTSKEVRTTKKRIAVTDKSVRDNTQRAIIKDGQITVESKSGRNKVIEKTFPLEKWAEIDKSPFNTGGNKKRLVEELGAMRIGDTPEDHSLGQRIIDAQIGAIEKAYNEHRDTVAEEDIDRKAQLQKVSQLYLRNLGEMDIPKYSIIDEKIWEEQMREQIENPERYSEVAEEENPKGIKIGDKVRIRDTKLTYDGEVKMKGESTYKTGVVTSIKKAPPGRQGSFDVHTINPNGYGHWSHIEDVNKEGIAFPEETENIQEVQDLQEPEGVPVDDEQYKVNLETNLKQLESIKEPNAEQKNIIKETEEKIEELPEDEAPLLSEGKEPPKPPTPKVRKQANDEFDKNMKKTSVKQGVKDLSDSYEALKDVWIGDKDIEILKAQVEKRLLQKELKEAMDEKKYTDEVKDVDRAIQIYIDTKRNPEHANEFYDQLTDEQRRIVDLSQNLSEKIKKIADKIADSYKKIGMEAMEEEVISNVLDNYVARIWDIKKEGGVEAMRKFGTKTRHAKKRTFGTIIEGWANDYNLKVEGATSNLEILKNEIRKTMIDKQFVSDLLAVRNVDGDPLLTTKKLTGYVKVEHPNFKAWKFAGKAEGAETYGRNFFVTEDGTLMERVEYYAPKDQANNLNNILGISKFSNMPGAFGASVDAITKYNAIIKSWVLQSSFFHHLAFMRSYYFGTNNKTWSEMNVIKAYKDGLKSIEDMNPELMMGVRAGLTLGIMQDWSEQLLNEKTIFGKMLDKNKYSKAIKDKINELRDRQANFLFGELGAGLKAKSFLIEFRNLTKKHPKMAPFEVARLAANLINDDFGGLHLQRLGRNPTAQHIFRIFALAPDWTESNVRTMVKAIRAGGKAETAMYRKFWSGAITKGIAITVLGNFLMAGGDWDEFLEKYKIAWGTDGYWKKLRWTGVDITPLYKATGGETAEHKYFAPLGHFLDVFKFITDTAGSAHHKGSIVFSMAFELLSGVDWAGRKFTEIGDLLKTGKTVKFGTSKAIGWKQLPSYLLNQIKGAQPVQVQNLLAWWAGEMEGFDAIGNSLGLGVRSTYHLGDEDTELDIKLKEQNKERKESTSESEKLYLDFKELTSAEANKNMEELKVSDKPMYDKVRAIAIAANLALSDEESKIKRLGVANEARAKYIYSEAVKLETRDEQNKYISDLQKKKVVTDEVLKQIKTLKKTGYKPEDIKEEAKKAETEEDIFEFAIKYAKAFRYDTGSALITMFTKEQLHKVEGKTVIMKREVLTMKEVADFKKEMGYGPEDRMELDHVIDRQLGGRMLDRDNWEIVDKETHRKRTAVGSYLRKKLWKDEITEKEARKAIEDFKNGEISFPEIKARF